MSEFQNVLEQLIGKQMTPPVLVNVDSVDESTLTMDCTPVAGGARILACRLRPVADGSGLGIVTIPKVNALALVLPLSNAEAVALAFSEFTLVKIVGDGLEIEAKSDGKVTLKGDVVIEGNVTLGSTQGAEPLLKGDKVGDRLGEVYAHLSALQSALMAMASAGAAACVGPLAPLAPSFSSLGAAIGPEIPATATDRAKFPLCKSQKCKTA